MKKEIRVNTESLLDRRWERYHINLQHVVPGPAAETGTIGRCLLWGFMPYNPSERRSVIL
jgi:hypothetical protein